MRREGDIVRLSQRRYPVQFADTATVRNLQDGSVRIHPSERATYVWLRDIDRTGFEVRSEIATGVQTLAQSDGGGHLLGEVRDLQRLCREKRLYGHAHSDEVNALAR